MKTLARIIMWIGFIICLFGTLYGAYQLFIAKDNDDDDNNNPPDQPKVDPNVAAAAAKAREAKEAKRREAMNRDASDAEIVDQPLNGKAHEKATEMAEGT